MALLVDEPLEAGEGALPQESRNPAHINKIVKYLFIVLFIFTFLLYI